MSNDKNTLDGESTKKSVTELLIFGSATNVFTAKTGRLLMRLGYTGIMYSPDGDRVMADKPLSNDKDGIISVEAHIPERVGCESKVSMHLVVENSIILSLDGIDLEDMQRCYLCEQFLLSYSGTSVDKIALTHAYYMEEGDNDYWNIRSIDGGKIYPAGQNKRKISLFVDELNRSHRPNLIFDGTLKVCWNLHDKDQDCEYEETNL